MRATLLRLIVIVLIAAAGQAAAADVARVLLAAGDTVAVRDNQTIKLTFGSTIQDKDVLRTGPASNLQARFADESIISMKQNSELRIDEFRFAGKEDGSERAFFRLLKGGLRTVTGLIGRANNKNYAMTTATATIGIRGTDYAATLCQQDCRNNDGTQAKDGLYGRVLGLSHGTNRIDVTNERDQKNFGINENFYVADAKSIVEPLLVPPDFVSNRLEGRKQGGSTDTSGGSGTEQATAGGAAAESRLSTTPELLPPPVIVTTVIKTTETLGQDCSGVNNQQAECTSLFLQGTSPVTPSPVTVSGQSGFAAGSITGLAALSATAVGFSHTAECDDANSCAGGIGTVTFDSSGYKRIDCGGGCFIDRNVATVSEIGSVAGVIEWGKWIGGPILAGGFYNNLIFGANQGLNYVVGVAANPMPTSGTATFTLLGATAPTFSDGVGGGLGTGAMTSGSASVDFLSRLITANMSLVFTGASGTSNYALAMTSGSIRSGTAALSGSGTLNFSSGAVNVCGPGCTTSFVGFFAGSNATHVGLGYDATATTPSTFFINGVAVLKR